MMLWTTFDLLADRPFVLVDFARGRHLVSKAFQDAVDGIQQIENAGLGLPAAAASASNSIFPGTREQIFSCRDFQGLQLRYGVLEFFVLNELPDEFPARIFALFFVTLHHGLLLHRQQLTAL